MDTLRSATGKDPRLDAERSDIGLQRISEFRGVCRACGEVAAT